MDIRTLIRAHLESIGADGLVNDGCGCDKDDLAPCGQCNLDCVPARLVIATEPGACHDIGDRIFMEMDIKPASPATDDAKRGG